MDDLWQQFHRLPKAIRDAAATPQVLAAIERLEKANPGLDLANFVMRLMIKEFPVSDLPKKLAAETKLGQAKSLLVSEGLKHEALTSLADYLGFAVTSTTTEAAAESKVAPSAVRTAVKPAVPVLPPAKLNAPAAAAKTPPFSAPPFRPVTSQPKAATAGSAASVLPPTGVRLGQPAPAMPPITPAGSLGQPAIPSAGSQSTPSIPNRPPLGQPASRLGKPGVPPPVPPPVKPGVAVSAPFGAPPLTVPAKPVGSIAPTQEYSADDTAEIERQSSWVQKNRPVGVADFDDVAKGVFEHHHLAWADELLNRRALAIAKARLKEIRDSQQTEAMLARDPQVGGLGLDPDIARQLTIGLDAAAKDLKAKGMTRPPAPIQPPPPVTSPPLQAARPLGQPPLTRVVPPGGLPLGPTPRPGVTEAPRPSRPIKRPPDIPPPAVSSQPAAVPTTRPMVQRPRQPDRPTISDITRPPKAYGPGEEMKSLTLTEWRRLGQGAAESARLLLEKFKNLQRESFPLWTAAMNGWRQSEVYQLYLDMGRQSLDQGMSIQDAIATRARSGQIYLSEHEFFTIADLNRQLQHY